MHNLFISVILFSVAFAAEGTPLSEQTKKDFIKVGVQTCLAKQRQDPLSKYMTESQLSEYCNCAMTRAYDFITLEDVGRMLQTKSNAHLVPVMETASNYCVQVLMKKWGYE